MRRLHRARTAPIASAPPAIATRTASPRSTAAIGRSTTQSIARQWDEELLDAIRRDTPRPTVHARNLFHLSAAMWDAWRAYGGGGSAWLTDESHVSADPARDRAIAISFAAYRLLAHALRARPGHGGDAGRARGRGWTPSASTSTSPRPTGDSPAAVGNRIGAGDARLRPRRRRQRGRRLRRSDLRPGQRAADREAAGHGDGRPEPLAAARARRDHHPERHSAARTRCRRSSARAGTGWRRSRSRATTRTTSTSIPGRRRCSARRATPEFKEGARRVLELGEPARRRTTA